jgi:hypothetical protein
LTRAKALASVSPVDLTEIPQDYSYPFKKLEVTADDQCKIGIAQTLINSVDETAIIHNLKDGDGLPIEISECYETPSDNTGRFVARTITFVGIPPTPLITNGYRRYYPEDLKRYIPPEDSLELLLSDLEVDSRDKSLRSYTERLEYLVEADE